MKKLIFPVFIICTLFVNAQRSYDLGLWGGGSYYLGDINTSFHFKSIHPSGGIFYRYNYNSRYGIRGSLFYGTLSGTDGSSKYIYQNIRGTAFSTPIFDLTGQFEFNFLPYVVGSDQKKFSPFVSSGLTFLVALNSVGVFHIAVPLGVGLKFNISERVGAGIEYSFRKTFSDNIDRLPGVDSNVGNFQSYNKQLAYYHDNDWYSFIGIFVSFNIKRHGGACEAYNY